MLKERKRRNDLEKELKNLAPLRLMHMVWDPEKAELLKKIRGIPRKKCRADL